MRNLLRLLMFFFAITIKLFPQHLSPQAGGEFKFEQGYPCITEEQRQMIIAENKIAIEELTAKGIIKTSKSAAVNFIWPLRAADNLNDYSYYGISNYVDHNPTYNNNLLDYNGGTRTYDLQGYNHAGTDVFTWPFGWYKMDNDQVEIVAAANGTIIGKYNGNYDRSCGFGGGNWNAIYLSHSDGSVSWYGHMKNNSLTAKGVGQTVTAGEYLGVVGSSGNSTGPHLHFEVYENSAQTILIDPWFGSSNPTISSSWWENQKPYFEPKINAVSTHSGFPQWPTCPDQELVKFKNNFVSTDTVYFVTYYQD
ncbi:MAG TPA: M23 family metallopeptidase, partial [Ignavibacteriaceae bacterium]|nr:M23 family metallopeptidase [Ignavibacteriaceae bacterium]